MFHAPCCPLTVSCALLAYVNAGRLTETGAVMGTPAYMSRERLLGEDPDLREDVYGLSVVLYQAITGELPFDGKNVPVLLAALITNRPQSILAHGVDDPDLWAILERGLAPRDERWASAWDLGKALAGWLWSHGSIDDIAGVSLRPIWIDDDARSLAGPGSSRVPTARLGVPIPAPETSLPPGASEPPPVPTGVYDSRAYRTTVRAITEPPRRRVLAVLGVALVSIGICSWAWPIFHDTGAASPPAVVEPAPSEAAVVLVPESATVPVDAGAPPTAQVPLAGSIP
jgi:serine/threonine-protein kinase